MLDVWLTLIVLAAVVAVGAAIVVDADRLAGWAWEEDWLACLEAELSERDEPGRSRSLSSAAESAPAGACVPLSSQEVGSAPVGDRFRVPGSPRFGVHRSWRT